MLTWPQVPKAMYVVKPADPDEVICGKAHDCLEAAVERLKPLNEWII
jgi:hypothetical protein